MLNISRKFQLGLLFSALIFGLNLFICFRIMRFDFTNHMGSIEGAYIGISRHFIDYWPDLAWWPAWYDGVPSYYSYPPFLHVLVAICSSLGRISVARSHHIVTALFYAAGPVSVLWLTQRLSGSPLQGFCCALFYSTFSPTSFFVQEVIRDQNDPLICRRLQTLIVYGDGPHIASLALVPIALLLIDDALRRRRPLSYLLAALGIATVALTNWLGAAALFLLVLSYLLSKTTTSLRHSLTLWFSTALLGLLAYALAAPLLPPELIRTVQFNAQTIGGDYRSATHNLLFSAPFIIIAVALGKGLMEALTVSRHIQTFSFFTLFVGWILMSMSLFKIPLVPQPERYALELDLALVPLVVGLTIPRLEQLSSKWKVVLVAVLCCFSVGQIVRNRRFVRTAVEPIRVEDTIEYQTASWIDKNLSGARVMALGSVEFWLNAFAFAPQQGGGFEQGNPNWENRVSQFIISSGLGAPDDGVEVTRIWLRAFGIEAIAVGGPQSRDSYKPFQRVERFAQLGTKIWSSGDDAIYSIPSRNRSLAHVMTKDEIVEHPPINGIDIAELRKYVTAIDDPSMPEASFQWTSQHSAQIKATLLPGQFVATQISYFPGWKVAVEGSARETFRDGIGLLVIKPECSGDCIIKLNYDGGRERVILYCLISVLALMIVWIALVIPFSNKNREAR